MNIPVDERFLNSVKHVHDMDEYMEEALHELTSSIHFARPSIFFTTRWFKLVQLVDNKIANMRLRNNETWETLVMSALILSIAEMDDDEFDTLYCTDIEKAPMDREDSCLYRALRNLVANEIQKDLLDGNTVYEYTHREVEWPESPDEDDDGPPYDMFADDESIEDTAFRNLILEQAKDMVSEME